MLFRSLMPRAIDAAQLKRGFYTEATIHRAHRSFRRWPLLELVPEYNPERPSGYLSALAACLLQDIGPYPDRLKRCQHTRKGKPCPCFFWDKSKGKRGKFCDNKACRNDRNTLKVQQWRKNQGKRKEVKHVTIRTTR